MPTHHPLSAFADLLRHLRQQRGLSQQKLADMAGLSVGAVSSAEAARSFPTVRSGVALHRALSRVQAIPADVTATWAGLLDASPALFTGSPLITAVLDAADPDRPGLSPPPDPAATAYATLGRLLAATNPAAVARVLDALEHLATGASTTTPSITADAPPSVPSLSVPPGAVRTIHAAPTGSTGTVAVYHPTTPAPPPPPTAKPARAKPTGGT